jgi:hypothetical protein
VTEGSKVRVWPHGFPDKFALGKVRIWHKDGLRIAVIFPDRSLFIGKRINLNNKPWGPWIDMVNGGHYEIEEEHDDKTANEAHRR